MEVNEERSDRKFGGCFSGSATDRNRQDKTAGNCFTNTDGKGERDFLKKAPSPLFLPYRGKNSPLTSKTFVWVAGRLVCTVILQVQVFFHVVCTNKKPPSWREVASRRLDGRSFPIGAKIHPSPQKLLYGRQVSWFVQVILQVQAFFHDVCTNKKPPSWREVASHRLDGRSFDADGSACTNQ